MDIPKHLFELLEQNRNAADFYVLPELLELFFFIEILGSVVRLFGFEKVQEHLRIWKKILPNWH